MNMLSPSGISRRQAMARVLATSVVAAMPSLAWSGSSPALLATNSSAPNGYRERYITRAGHRLYVRDYPGAGPVYVMVHGFPDNCRIYHDIASRLSASGRRVVTFDFLGFGRSDKPEGYRYTFAQQLADLTAVVEELGAVEIIPVGHDAGGPAAINYAISNESRVSSLVLFNCYYANSPVLRFPEFIELCCNPKTQLLGRSMMTNPEQAAWLFNFQQTLLMEDMTLPIRRRFESALQPIIAENFTQSPSAMPAFLDMTGNAYENMRENDARLEDLSRFSKPVKLIWGSDDEYLNNAVAEDIAAHFPKATIDALAATTHWPQFDRPDECVLSMLSPT